MAGFCECGDELSGFCATELVYSTGISVEQGSPTYFSLRTTGRRLLFIKNTALMYQKWNENNSDHG
jgi:hypothetical protein